MLPKPLGIQDNAQLPDQPNRKRKEQQGAGIETSDKNHGRKHHQMVPIKNPAGGTAAVFQNQTEGAPDQNANQITYIKGYADQKKHGVAEDAVIIKDPDHRQQDEPQEHHQVRRPGGGDDILPQGMMVDLFPDRAEPLAKQLLGAERHLLLDRHKLGDHVAYPHGPQQMENRKPAEEVPFFQKPKLRGMKDKEKRAQNENHAARDQPYDVCFSDGGHAALGLLSQLNFTAVPKASISDAPCMTEEVA